MDIQTGKHGLAALARKYALPAYCLLTSFAVLAVCSKSSFLYPFNDWVDANCYFTVGKDMMLGKVVYRDLFEQKGILLYFLHGLAYLVSHTTFIGVFFIEVAAGTAFLYCAAKTICLFLEGKWAYLLVPALAALTYSSSFFAHGDSAEELCLPLLAGGLLTLFMFIQKEGSLKPRHIVLTGALAGCVLWIKYTMLGFFAAWILAIFVGFLLKKRPRAALMSCLYFLAGVGLATAPWFIYFAANGALVDWFYSYFYLNATAYAKLAGVWDMAINAYTNVSRTIADMPVLSLLVVAAILSFVCTNRLLPGIWPKLSFALCYGLLIFGVYCGSKIYPYYFLILMGMLLLPGLIVAAKVLSRLFGLMRKHLLKHGPNAKFAGRIFAVCCAATFALGPVYAWQSYQYRDFMTVDRAALAQYRFAEIMNREENSTLLNYGFLDGGFYTAADILPTTKYFCKLNVPLPEMTKTQDWLIRNKAVRFVVVRSGGGGRVNAGGSLQQNYELVESVKQTFEGKAYTYSLYKVKS